jgi:hypothetical protein
MMSGPLPGAEGTIIRIAFAGYCAGVWAAAVPAARIAGSMAIIVDVLRMTVLPLFFNDLSMVKIHVIGIRRGFAVTGAT